MKLNPDCIRDIMLFCEKNCYVIADDSRKKAAFHTLDIYELHKLEPFPKYPIAELMYHAVQLSESGYLVTDFKFFPDGEDNRLQMLHIYYVTPKGHEFVGTITESKLWGTTLRIIKGIGSISLSIIETIAQGVTTAAIESAVAKMGKP
jgi:hypothetical protein|nr:MAG TPA: YjcQ protein [Caudoviricetes sp.]DAZ77213.1 MAG TPA: YjcQ protein [Caudoviricetes sp.]